MYRVSSKGIIVIEGNDSLLIKIANYFGMSQEYELSAVISGDYSHDLGGVDNTNIPNYLLIYLFFSVKPILFYKVKTFFKWKPKTTFDKGLEKTINWYKKFLKYDSNNFTSSQ